jgi:hypothetical protein
MFTRRRILSALDCAIETGLALVGIALCNGCLRPLRLADAKPVQAFGGKLRCDECVQAAEDRARWDAAAAERRAATRRVP